MKIDPFYHCDTVVTHWIYFSTCSLHWFAVDVFAGLSYLHCCRAPILALARLSRLSLAFQVSFMTEYKVGCVMFPCSLTRCTAPTCWTGTNTMPSTLRRRRWNATSDFCRSCIANHSHRWTRSFTLSIRLDKVIWSATWLDVNAVIGRVLIIVNVVALVFSLAY